MIGSQAGKGTGLTDAEEDLVQLGVPLHGHDGGGHGDTAHERAALAVEEHERAAEAVAAGTDAGENQPLVRAERHLRRGVVGRQVGPGVHRRLELAQVPLLHRSHHHI